MGDGGIGDQLLDILLHHRDERRVDDRNDESAKTSGAKSALASGNIGSEKTDEAVATHFQQDFRRGSQSRRSVLPHAHPAARYGQATSDLHRERGEEGEPQQVCMEWLNSKAASFSISAVPAVQIIAMTARSISTEPSSV